MNKKDLIQALTKVLSTKKEATQAIARTFSTMREALRSGDKVVISDFGSFKVKLTRAKRFRNPKTGKKTLLSPKKKVKFRPAKNLF